MGEERIERMTLRELYSHAEQALNELSEHLELGFLPKVQEFSNLLQEAGTSEEALADITVRTRAAALIDNEKFTAQSFERLSMYLKAIDKHTSKIVLES